MFTWLLVVAVLILLTAEMVAVVVFGVFILISLKAEVPFVPTKTEVLEEIKEILNLEDGDCLYDLGCGNGKVIGYLAALYPQVKFVGIELNLIPLWWGKWQFRHLSNLTIKRGNFYTTDLSEATKVFAYLYPEVITKLLPRFKSNLTPGTKVFSLDFPIADYSPTAVIDFTDKKFKLSKKIFVYQF